MRDGTVMWPRGKMLGGSSSMNGMIYFKGSSFDYQRWYDEGNKEWCPEIVERYFKKAENLQDHNLLKDNRVRLEYGHSGPLVINTFNSTYRSLTDKVLSAWDEIGFKTVKDLNAANVMGSGIFRVTATGGRREDTATAYLINIQNRKNLKILKNTLATKVIINKYSKETLGVEVEHKGNIQKYFAQKEVVLSAGAINTPQILMISGIGPRDHLLSKNIDTIVNSPAVGQHLKDHVIVPVTIYGQDHGQESTASRHFQEIEYLYNRTGYLAQVSFKDISAFYSVRQDSEYPDFQSHLNIFFKNSSNTLKYFNNIARYKSEVVQSVVKQNQNQTLYLFLFNLLHPYSTGNISLQSNDIHDKPKK